MRLVTWNTDNSKPNSMRGRAVANHLVQLEADVICLTEAFRDVLPAGGEIIEPRGDWGYELADDRRRVLLWSRHGWDLVEDSGPAAMPPGRFVRGRTHGLTIVGVCIPWRHAHVRTGSRDRRPWEDHLSYLAALPEAVQASGRTVILGDYNQRVPRRRQPHKVAMTLLEALQGFQVVTAGVVPGLAHQVIDHVAVTPDLGVGSVEGWEVLGESGRPVSDHSGVTVDLIES